MAAGFDAIEHGTGMPRDLLQCSPAGGAAWVPGPRRVCPVGVVVGVGGVDGGIELGEASAVRDLGLLIDRTSGCGP